MTIIKKSPGLARLVLIGLLTGVIVGAGLGAAIGANSPSPDQYNSPAVGDLAREGLKAANAPSPVFVKLTELTGGSTTLAGGLIGGTSSAFSAQDWLCSFGYCGGVTFSKSRVLS